MALTLEQLAAERDKIIKQLSLPQEAQSGDKRVVAQTADDLMKRLATIDSEIAKVQNGSSGYVSRFFTR